MDKLHIGIDLGGTKIASGIVDSLGRVIASDSLSTPRGAQNIADAAYACAMNALGRCGLKPEHISSVGVGIPGTVYPNGIVGYACNLALEDTPLGNMLESKFHMPVYIENDANCAAVGEYFAGCGKGAASLLIVTLGTGIGGGFIENGRLFRGFNGCGGELGHMVIVHDGAPCSCSRRGCFEAYASVSALIAALSDYVANAPESPCAGIVHEQGIINGHTVFEAMDAGDTGATAVYMRYVNYLACGITNLINIFQPEILCIGGGISARGERLLSPVREIVSRENYARNCMQKTVLTCAQNGNNAGIIGAALLHNLIRTENG